MSNNKPETQSAEEVDLGQLFKLIGNGFRNLFNFIGKILNKLFLAFVWMVFFVKMHLIKIVVSIIIGFGLGYAKQKIGEPLYKSEVFIKQNYNTGESLYGSLDYINQLISEKDSLSLKNTLKINNNKAVSLIGIDIEPIINNNQRMSLFDEYTKSLDSVLATNIDFETYVENYSDFSFGRQKITLWTKSKESSNGIVSSIINNIEALDYFKNEQKKDLAELSKREDILRESLLESDSLQKVYKNVLESTVENPAGSQTSITIDNNEDKAITKEYELYNSDLLLRRELVNINREKEDKEHIIEIVSSQFDKGTLYNKATILGIDTDHKIKYAVLLGLFVLVILLGLEFLKFLERFKDKI